MCGMPHPLCGRSGTATRPLTRGWGGTARPPPQSQPPAAEAAKGQRKAGAAAAPGMYLVGGGRAYQVGSKPKCLVGWEAQSPGSDTCTSAWRGTAVHPHCERGVQASTLTLCWLRVHRAPRDGPPPLVQHRHQRAPRATRLEGRRWQRCQCQAVRVTGRQQVEHLASQGKSGHT